jgi:hypothetical protein
VIVPAGFVVTQVITPSTPLSFTQTATFQVALDPTAAVGSYSGNITFSNYNFSIPVSGSLISATNLTQIVDDSDSGFNVNNTWTNYFGQGNNNTVHYAAVGNGNETATWTFAGLPAGTYDVAFTYSVDTNRAHNATYTVNYGLTTEQSQTVNQTVAPSADITVGSVHYQYVGGSGATFHIDGSQPLTVTLTDNNPADISAANTEYLIADAIRVERLSPQQLAANVANVSGIIPQSEILTQDVAQQFVDEAARRWELVDPTAAATLANVRVIVGQLPAGYLGLNSAETKTIWLSSNAASQGWFIDRTPMWDEEFTGDIAQIPEAMSHIDLLTVAAHELGHILGFPDLPDDDTLGSTMSISLGDGLRRVPFTSMPSSSDMTTSLVAAPRVSTIASLRPDSASADSVFTELGIPDLIRAKSALLTTPVAVLSASQTAVTQTLTARQRLNTRVDSQPSSLEGAHADFFAQWGLNESRKGSVDGKAN